MADLAPYFLAWGLKPAFCWHQVCDLFGIQRAVFLRVEHFKG